MTAAFNRGVVKPFACFESAFALIKDQYWLFFGISFVALLIGSLVPFGILWGPMMCGLYLCFFAKMRGERVQFDQLFKGFDHFAQSLIVALVLFVPMILVMIVAYVSAAVISVVLLGGRRGQPDGATFVVLLLVIGLCVGVAMLIVWSIALLFTFSFPLIVERRMSAGEALKTSARAVLGNAGGMVGLFLLNLVLGLVSMLVFCVGSYLVMPISLASYAVAYRKVFPELKT